MKARNMSRGIPAPRARRSRCMALALGGALLLTLGVRPVMQDARAEEWIVVGARARAMGGAGVATARGSEAIYWNPAMLGYGSDTRRYGRESWMGLRIPFSAELSFQGNLIQNADRASKLMKDFNGIQQKLDGGTPLGAAEVSTLFNIVDALNKMDEPGQGALVNFDMGPRFSMGHFGVFADAQGYVATEPVTDFSVQGGGSLLTGDTTAAGGVSADKVNKFLGSLPDTDGSRNLTLPPNDPSLGYDAVSVARRTDLAGLLANNPSIDTALTNANVTVSKADAINQIVNNIPEDIVKDPKFNDYKNLLNQLLDSTFGSTIVTAPVSAPPGGPGQVVAPATGGQKTFADNDSGVNIQGIMMAEAGVAISSELIPNTLSIGWNLKAIQGTTFRQQIKAKDADSDDFQKELRESFNKQKADSVRYTFDMGLVVQPANWYRFGITGRNLIRPKFDYSADADGYWVDPQIRTGVALQPWSRVTLAADYDLLIPGISEGRSKAFPSYRSQFVGAGLEVVPMSNALLGVALRAGANKNLKSDEKEATISGGVGLRILFIEAEVAGTYSLNTTEVESGDQSTGKKAEEVPSRFGFAATIGLSVTF